MELLDLFERVVPDFAPDFEPSQNVDEDDEDTSYAINSLATGDLKEFYDELSRFLVSKGLTPLQNKVKGAIIRYFLRVNEPDLAEAIGKKTIL